MDIIEQFEREAAEATANYVQHELARIQPLLDIGEPYTSEDSCTTDMDYNSRDCDLLQSIGYAEEIVRRYEAIPGDTSVLVRFVGQFRQKCIDLLSKRPAPKFLN